MISHLDKILPRMHSPPLTFSSHSNITSCHDKDDAPYASHSPILSLPPPPPFPPIDVFSSPASFLNPPFFGFWLNTDDSADYYPFNLPIAGAATIRAKYIKYKEGINPYVLGMMSPNPPICAKPIILPHPPATNPLPLTPQQCQQLLFGSKLAD